MFSRSRAEQPPPAWPHPALRHGGGIDGQEARDESGPSEASSGPLPSRGELVVFPFGGRPAPRAVPSPAEQPRNAYDRDGWWVDPDAADVADARNASGDDGRDSAGDDRAAADAELKAPRAPLSFVPRGADHSDAVPLADVPGLCRAAELAATRPAERGHLPWRASADGQGAAGVRRTSRRAPADAEALRRSAGAAPEQTPRLRARGSAAGRPDVEQADLTASQPSDAEQRATAEQVLLKKLRGRGMSIAEASSHLRGIGIDDSVASEVIEAFVDRGYLDDAVLAEQLVYAAVSKKAQGRRAIARALSTRGIPREVADAALAELPDDDEERALEFARTKARSMSSLQPEAALRRLIGQLARRGFTGADAMRAARQALAEDSGPRLR